MSEYTKSSEIATAIGSARLRAWRTGLLTLHKALLDAERTRYARTHGPIQSPHEALRLVLHDPWFAWLRPLADLIVQIDERLADPEPIVPVDVTAVGARVRQLLHLDTAEERFRDEYRRALQDLPEVVVAHGQLVSLLAHERPG